MDSEFWGCVIPAGRAVRVEVATDEEYVHVSQAALGADARAGRTTVTLAVADDAEASGARDGARHALCALTRDASASISSVRSPSRRSRASVVARVRWFDARARARARVASPRRALARSRLASLVERVLRRSRSQSVCKP